MIVKDACRNNRDVCQDQILTLKLVLDLSQNNLINRMHVIYYARVCFGQDWSCASICPTAQPLLLVYVLKGGHVLQANKNTVFNESWSFGLDFEGLCVDPTSIIPPGFRLCGHGLPTSACSSHRRCSSGTMCKC